MYESTLVEVSTHLIGKHQHQKTLSFVVCAQFHGMCVNSPTISLVSLTFVPIVACDGTECRFLWHPVVFGASDPMVVTRKKGETRISPEKANRANAHENTEHKRKTLLSSESKPITTEATTTQIHNPV